MADEYIKREAVSQVLQGIANGLLVGETEALKAKDMKSLLKIKAAKEILKTVDNDLCFIPTADVQPVKRGRWINIYEYCKMNGYKPSGVAVYFWCSECMKEQEKTSDFCSNCGADMRETKKG